MQATNDNVIVRPIYKIAIDIRADWKKIHFAARPYLDAMFQMDSIDRSFGYDSGKEIVLYFLSNASSWRGPVAKKIKEELKALCKMAK